MPVGPFYSFFAIGLELYFANQGAACVGWPVIGGFSRLIVAFGGALTLITLTNLGVQAVFASIAAGMLAYGTLTARSDTSATAEMPITANMLNPFGTVHAGLLTARDTL